MSFRLASRFRAGRILQRAAWASACWGGVLAGASLAQTPEVAPSTEQHDVTDEDLFAFRLAVLEQIAEQGLASDASVYLASLSLSQDIAPLPPQLMQPNSSRIALPSSSTAANVFRGGAPRSNLPTDRAIASKASSSDRVLGIEARVRNTTDSGSLLGASTNSSGVTTQKRNPIISDPRIRGSRVGQVAASGSYWVPARIDLDTMLSKIDSQLIDEIKIVKGPYSSLYGPGSDFIDFQLKRTPRSESGTDIGGSSSLNYQTNGEQWYGRQSGYVAGENWGARVGYGQRTGTDYKSGNGQQIPSSYKSRDLDVAVGMDFSDDKNLEVIYLHQDQTDVELAGQAFDLDSLLTNGVEATWTDRGIAWADRLVLETWYNETRLKGNAQSPAKRQTFPFLDVIRYRGVTNVDSVSTGSSARSVWELDTDRELTVGADVRVVRQGLDEISSGRFGFSIFTNANSPIPRSVSVNPGLLAELRDTSIEGLTLTTGVRADAVSTEVLEDAARLQQVGTGSSSYTGMLGTSDLDQSFGLWSTYLTAAYELDSNWTLTGGVGHGQRPPSLTELYAAESFMFLLQNGLNTVTGDPRLNPERRTQIDLGLAYDDDRFRAGVTGFHAWVNDRITFEAMSVRRGPPFGNIEQVNLRYVNTDLAALYGFEANAEYDVAPWVSVFSTLNYVEGTDLSRNGNYATQQASGATASQQVSGVARGTFANTGAALNNHEPLPGIAPLVARSGVRFNGHLWDTLWNVELAARMVGAQDRVASSLLESTTPGFTVFDLRTHWLVNHHLSFVSGVENITDKNYREHFDFRSASGLSVYQPGVNFYFGSELQY